MNGGYNLPTNGMDTTNVLSGSYMPMQCNTGYIYASGQLNITCVGNAWTTFPLCALKTATTSMTNAAISTGNGAPCTIDAATTFNITNGYSSSSSLSYTSATNATGNRTKSTL
jgi:hypothetical protein